MRSASATNYHGVYFLTVDDDGLDSSASGRNQTFSGDNAAGMAASTWSTYGSMGRQPRLCAFGSDFSTTEVKSDSAQFAALFSMIDDMLALPQGFSDGVDVATAMDAERVLAFIESSGVDAPKIFSHGGDAIVFTWDKGSISKYVTISDGDAAFLVVNKLTKMQCPYEIVSLDTPEISALLTSVDSSLKAKSNAK